MPNMSLKKVPMPTQNGDVRKRNFDEVAAGYTRENAIEEANRCLNCKNHPCVQGCPVNVKIPEFIAKVSQGDFEEAYKIIKESNALPAVCGRVCPQENQCEKYCVRGIKGESVAIGRLERFVADYCMKNEKEEALDIKENGKKVAIIGSGPAGLACAGDLRKKGYDVTIFEAFHVAGGVLMYGIPQFRLPKDIVQKEIDGLKQIGVKVETNVVIGKTFTIDELKENGYKAIFVGSGAGLPKFMDIDGEYLNGVYSANEFLTRINLMKAYKFPEYDTPIFIGDKVAVVGGGNVAMDAARCAMRLGASEVHIVYRRGEEEMPARREEIEHAKEEGIIFDILSNPIKIIGNEENWVKGIECVKMELLESDSSGRKRPVEIKNSNFVIDVDSVIMAIGQSSNPLIKNTTKNLNTNDHGCIIVNEDGATNIEGIYAGGDVVTGAATVILAMGAGKKVAKSIDKYLTNY